MSSGLQVSRSSSLQAKAPANFRVNGFQSTFFLPHCYSPENLITDEREF
jgi:hypothetical protein